MNSNTSVINTICLGPSGSGKTLLLRSLQNANSVDVTTTSVPTVGTNLYTLKRTKNGNANVEISICVRELGGVMAPLWSKYFDNIKKILYVVDTSNLCQISAASVLLYTTLSHPKLKQTKFMLVLTKMDVSYRQMRNEALLMLQMKRLQNEIKQKIEIVEASAINGEGKQEILDWLFKK